MTEKLPYLSETWSPPVQKDWVFTLRINRRLLCGLIISILLHLAVLWFFAPRFFSMGVPEQDSPPLQITLGPPQKKETAQREAVQPDLRPLPQPIPEAAKSKPKTKQKVIAKKPPVKVVEKSETTITKQEPLKRQPPKPRPEPTSPQPLPGEDMQAYIRRQKAAQLAQKGLSEHDIEEVLASSTPKSDGNRRDARIKKNLDLEGTNGIFSIRNMSVRTAQFSFRGWKNNINTARLEIIDVRAADGVDIKKAIIRKMIAIIRREYSGDFKWDSRRLNQVLTLSARPKDTQALEGFMMLEFFGPGTPYGLSY